MSTEPTHVSDIEAAWLSKPTTLRPGSEAKLALMRQRVAAGLDAIVEGDAYQWGRERKEALPAHVMASGRACYVAARKLRELASSG